MVSPLGGGGALIRLLLEYNFLFPFITSERVTIDEKRLC